MNMDKSIIFVFFLFYFLITNQLMNNKFVKNSIANIAKTKSININNKREKT